MHSKGGDYRINAETRMIKDIIAMIYQIETYKDTELLICLLYWTSFSFSTSSRLKTRFIQYMGIKNF